jgi:hypothetical protein
MVDLVHLCHYQLYLFLREKRGDVMGALVCFWRAPEVHDDGLVGHFAGLEDPIIERVAVVVLVRAQRVRHALYAVHQRRAKVVHGVDLVLGAGSDQDRTEEREIQIIGGKNGELFKNKKNLSLAQQSSKARNEKTFSKKKMGKKT